MLLVDQKGLVFKHGGLLSAGSQYFGCVGGRLETGNRHPGNESKGITCATTPGIRLRTARAAAASGDVMTMMSNGHRVVTLDGAVLADIVVDDVSFLNCVS